MTKTSLSEIIEALTANEKRNFQLSNAAHKKQNYFQVYRALEKTSFIGNKEIKQQVQNKKMNVPYEKKYLHKMLSRSLRNFYEDSSSSITLQQNFIDIEILFKKGLWRPCLEIIQNSKIIAQKHELFLSSLQLLHWELKCIVQTGNFNALKDFINYKTNQEKELHAKQLDYENAVFQKASLVGFFMTEGLSKSAKSKHQIPIILKEIKSGYRNTISFIAFLQYAESLIFYYNILGKMKQGVEVSENVLLQFDKNPGLRYLFTPGYVSMLGNYCQHVLFVEVSSKLKARIKEYEAIISDKKMDVAESVKEEIRISTTIILFDIHAKEGDFTTMLPAVMKITENFPASVDKLRSDQAISVCNMVAIALLLNKHTEKALVVIDYSLNRFRDQIRLDMYFCFQIQYLLAQFDIKNYEVLPSLIRGVKRFFDNRCVEIKSPYKVLDLLSELIKCTPKQRKPLLESCFNELLLLSDTNEEDLFLGSSKILYWLKRKMSDT